MKASDRIGILLFLHSRNELSGEEEKELGVWRGYSPENERLYHEMGDPEFLRNMMTEYYGERARVFNRLKTKFPSLPSPDFYLEDDPENDSATAKANEEKRIHFPEKNIAESGLSKAEFWASLLEEAQFSENEPLSENEADTEESVNTESKKKKPGRVFRIILRSVAGVAASVMVTIALLNMFGKSSSSRFEASFSSSDGFHSALDDFHRGFLDGYANISFEKTAKGEPVSVFTNAPKAAKSKNYTVETNNGDETILRLPDGIMIWMDPNSTVNFPANFSRDTIHLRIEGKVYIESSAKKHLIIEAGKQRSTGIEIDIEPSVAVFDLSAYPGDSAFIVNTVSGSAKLSTQGTGQSLGMEAGKRISVNGGLPSLEPAADTAEILATKNGEIYLKDVSLQTILSTIARWYNVEIRYDTEIPAGKFSLRVPLESRLGIIIESLTKQGVTIAHQGNTIKVGK